MIDPCCCSEQECHVLKTIFLPHGRKKKKKTRENKRKNLALLAIISKYSGATDLCYTFFLTETHGQSSQGWLLSNLFKNKESTAQQKILFFIMQEVTYFRGCKVDDQIFWEHLHSFILAFNPPYEVSQNEKWNKSHSTKTISSGRFNLNCLFQLHTKRNSTNLTNTIHEHHVLY